MEEKHRIHHSSTWGSSPPLYPAHRGAMLLVLGWRAACGPRTVQMQAVPADAGETNLCRDNQRWPIGVKGICASSGSPPWPHVRANRKKYRSNLKLTPAFSEVSFVIYEAVQVLRLLSRASLRRIFSPEGLGYVKVYHFRAGNLHMWIQPLTHLL